MRCKRHREHRDYAVMDQQQMSCGDGGEGIRHADNQEPSMNRLPCSGTVIGSGSSSYARTGPSGHSHRPQTKEEWLQFCGQGYDEFGAIAVHVYGRQDIQSATTTAGFDSILTNSRHQPKSHKGLTEVVSKAKHNQRVQRHRHAIALVDQERSNRRQNKTSRFCGVSWQSARQKWQVCVALGKAFFCSSTLVGWGIYRGWSQQCCQ